MVRISLKNENPQKSVNVCLVRVHKYGAWKLSNTTLSNSSIAQLSVKGNSAGLNTRYSKINSL